MGVLTDKVGDALLDELDEPLLDGETLGPPEVRVHVGYGSTWQTEDAAIIWTEETGRVNDRRELVSVFRGATSAHGKAGAGKLNLTLNNRDRRFDPLHASGPLFGDLVPGVPIKVSVGGVQVGRGFVKSWPQHPDGPTFSVVPIEAVDGFQNLARAPVPGSVLEYEILQDSPVHYWPLTDEAGLTMRDLAASPVDGEYQVGTTTGLERAGQLETGLEVGGVVFDGEHVGTVKAAGIVIDSRPVVIEIVASGVETLELGDSVVLRTGSGNADTGITIQTAAGTTWVMSARVGGNDFIKIEDLTKEGAVHPIAYRCPVSGDAVGYLDGVDATTTVDATPPASSSTAALGVTIGGKKASGGNIELAHAGFLAHVAIFDTDIGAARIAAHADAALNARNGETADSRIGWLLDVIDWPTDLRDLSAGQSKLSPAILDRSDNALSYFQLVEASEDGRLFISRDGKLTLHDRFFPFTAAEASISQFTFTDVAADNHGYADFVIEPQAVELVVNAYSYSRRGGSELRDVDTTSRDLHGYREDSRNDLLLGTDNEVRSRGDWTLTTRATALPQVDKIRIPLHRYSPSDQYDVLSLDLGHRVSAVRTPQGVGDPIELDFIVSGIKIAAGVAECWVELYVSPAVSDEITLFTLGTSTLGGTDVLAY